MTSDQTTPLMGQSDTRLVVLSEAQINAFLWLRALGVAELRRSDVGDKASREYLSQAVSVVTALLHDNYVGAGVDDEFA